MIVFCRLVYWILMATITICLRYLTLASKKVLSNQGHVILWFLHQQPKSLWRRWRCRNLAFPFLLVLWLCSHFVLYLLIICFFIFLTGIYSFTQACCIPRKLECWGAWSLPWTTKQSSIKNKEKKHSYWLAYAATSISSFSLIYLQIPQQCV